MAGLGDARPEDGTHHRPSLLDEHAGVPRPVLAALAQLAKGVAVALVSRVVLDDSNPGNQGCLENIVFVDAASFRMLLIS